MAVTAKHAKLVGSPLSSIWAQVATLTSQSHDDSNLGKLHIVVQITRTDDEEAAFFGKHIIDAAQNAYFAKESDSVFAALQRTLKSVEELLQREGDKLETPSFLAIVTVENKIYVGKVGNGLIVLFRSNQLLPLVHKARELQIVSGVVKPHDYIILGTESFFEHAYPTKELFDGKNSPQDIVDILSPILLSLPQNADIASFIQAFYDEAGANEQLPGLSAGKEEAFTAIPLQTSVTHPLESASAPQKSKLVINVRQMYQNAARPMLYAIAKQARVEAFLSRRAKIPSPGGVKKLPLAFLPTGRLRVLLLGLVVGVVVVAVLFFGTSMLLKKRQQGQVSNAYNLAHKHLTVAQSIKSQDPKRARELLEQAQEALATAKQKKTAITEPSGLQESIAAELAQLTQNDRIANPQVFFDTLLVKDNFSATKLDAVEASLLVVDAKAPTLLRVDKQKKLGAIATGGEKVKGLLATSFAGSQILVTTQEGVFAVNEQNGEGQKLIAREGIWGNITDMAFYNDNVYLLDAGNQQIWKYSKEGGNYTAGKNVIADEDKSSFITGNDIVIDGSVWVAGSGTIVRITNGKIAKYTVPDLSEGFGSFLRIATTLDSKQLYILDKEKHRVVVAGKDGKLVREYASESFNNVVDIAVDEKANILYLLTENKILSIPLT